MAPICGVSPSGPLSGHYEIYVQRYPNGALSRVSPDSGQRPLWNPKGGEIFYQKSTEVFAVRVVNGQRVGSSVPFFERSNATERNWAVAPDGQRFLVRENVRPAQMEVVLNWFEELKAKVPTK